MHNGESVVPRLVITVVTDGEHTHVEAHGQQGITPEEILDTLISATIILAKDLEVTEAQMLDAIKEGWA